MRRTGSLGRLAQRGSVPWVGGLAQSRPMSIFCGMLVFIYRETPRRIRRSYERNALSNYARYSLGSCLKLISQLR